MSKSAQQLNWLLGFGGVIAALLCVVVMLSRQFELSIPVVDRPIIEVVIVFAIAFVVYLFSIVIARRIADSRKLTLTIVGFAIAFRMLMFLSTPIQEVDIYRYIWDGVVVSEGVSPFRFSPEQVRTTNAEDTTDVELLRLITKYHEGSGVADSLDLVHFGQIQTVYPPVSQFVFGVAALVTADDASLLFRIRTMKAVLLLFDVGTILVLIALLKLLEMPTGLSIAYAWCPLVLKELGNSGHLDSIAIFLTTVAVWLFVRNVLVKFGSAVSKSSGVAATANLWPVIFLALAIGAKIYAIVLTPLFCLMAIKRLGWRATVVPTLVFMVTTALVMWPMLPARSSGIEEGVVAQANDPSSGVVIFLKYWEMNDFLFMCVVENLKPTPSESDAAVWFSIVPDQSRKDLVDAVQFRFDPEPNIAPFLTARILLSLVFFVLAVGIAIWAARRDEPADFCRAAFLTLAWFWLLSPTQNPWYWLWALPLIPFVKNRTWYLMSGLLFIYYTRFWFESHFADQSVLGSGWGHYLGQYKGVAFFDYVVAWLEYGPWFVLLLIETIAGSIGKTRSEE